MMADYIDREVYIKSVKDIPLWGSVAAMMADCIPAADVVEVVRCVDCKHLYFKDMSAYCPHKVSACRPDGFCSYGERKDENLCDHCMSGSYRGCNGCGYAERKDGDGNG